MYLLYGLVSIPVSLLIRVLSEREVSFKLGTSVKAQLQAF